MEKKIEKKFPLHYLLLFTISVVVLLTIGSWIFYLSAENYLDRLTGEELSRWGDILGRLKMENPKSFQLLLNYLLKKGNIRGVVLYEEGKEEVYGDLNPEEILLLDREEQKTAWEGGLSYTPYYYLEGEIFKRGYAPLRDKEGIKGIIGVEGRAEILKPLWGIRRSLFISTGILNLLLFLILILFSLLYNRYFYTLERLRFREKISLMGDTLSSIFHALGNPLGIMQSTLSLLKKEEDQKEREKLIRYLEEEVEKISRISRGFFPREEKFSLQELTREILYPLEKVLKEENIEVEAEWQEKDCIIQGDRDKLRRVFLNLITNAREAISGRGRISLRIFQRGRYFIWEIRDNGEGMEKTILANLFQPGLSTRGEGRGWGLAEVREIVESMGGRIRVTSRKGKGTRVTLYFPVIF